MPAARVVPSSDGHPVATWDFGGEGRDVLLAHANGFHSHLWLPVVEHLRDGFRCVGFDLRGQGDTPPPADMDFAWARFAADALAVVDAYGLDHPFAVGHSGGGGALCLAEASRPGTFSAMYLYEPILFPADPNAGRGNAMAEGARRRREVFPGVDAAYEGYRGRGPFATWRDDALRLYVEHGLEALPDGTYRLKARGEHEARVYEGATESGAFEGLGRVRCPVTVAVGERTEAPPPAMFRNAAAALPQGRFAVEPALTHFGPFEDPVAVAAAIRRAFAR